MISNDLMRHRAAGTFIDRAVNVMISVETMKHRSAKMVGDEFPLVSRPGNARIVRSDDSSIALQVGGILTDLSWERLTTTWKRFLANHTLSVDELGGGVDAVGIVSLFAEFQRGGLRVIDADGVLVLEEPDDSPVHQYADMSRPSSSALWRRKSAKG